MSDSTPKDLQTSPQPDTDRDYFNFKATNLKIDQNYAIKFQWVYSDGTLSEWSPGKFVNTNTEAVPGAPSATVPLTSIGNIPVTLSTFPTNAKRVDVYVIGGIYGTGKVVDYFLAPGTKTISINEPGVYQVSLIAVTPSGINGDPTNTFTITVAASAVDTTALPGAPSGVVVNAFNEPTDPLNRTGYINTSWSAGSDSSGYIVGVWEVNPETNPTAKPSQYTVTETSAKIEGLRVGKQYYVKVRSENKFNNLSAWVAPASNYPVTIPGTVLVPGAVTVSGTAAPRSIVISWGDPASNAALVTNGGYYEIKLYTNNSGTGTPLETRKAWSNLASFSGLTTGTSYWVTVQPYTAGDSPVAGALSSVYGPLIPSAIDNPDLKGDFVLASNQLQVGGTSGANDIHLSAYTKTVGGLSTQGRIYIGGPETSGSVAVGLYNNSGTPFYADNLGRFSLGDKLTWSGNLATPVLNVKGIIDVTGASTFSNYIVAGATPATLNLTNYVGIGFDVPYKNNSSTTNATLTGIVINKYAAGNTTSDWIKSDGTFRLGGGKLIWDGDALSVTGGGSFTGDISGANGTFTGSLAIGTSPNIFKAEPATGIWLGGDGTYSGSNFSVSTTGILKANAGTVGGWAINSTQIRSNSANQISLNPSTPKIALIQGATLNGATGLYEGGTEKITIDPIEGIVGPNITYGGQQVPAFKLTPSGALTLYGSINVIGGNAATSDQVNAKNKTFYQNDEPTNPISGYSLVAGDIWFDLNDNNKQYRWSGSAWQAVQDGTIVTAYNAAIAAQNAVQNKLNKSASTITDVNNNITAINANGIQLFATGSTDTSATSVPSSGNRIIINYQGIQAYDSQGPSFQLLAGGGTATFRGSIESGSTITGSRVSTGVDSYFGSIRMGYTEGFGSGSTLEVVGANGAVYGQLYQFNNGNELILRHGSSREAGGYPTNSSYLSLNPTTTSLGYSDSSGLSSFGLDISADGSHRIAGTITGLGNGTIAIPEFRNISAGSTAKNTSDSSGYIGDIYIQY